MNFPIISCPPEVRREVDFYKDLLGNYYKAFTAVFCGYYLGISSFSNIVRYLFFSPSVSNMSAMMNCPDLFMKLNRRHRKRILSLLRKSKKDSSRYRWVIDDTIIPHWGKNIWGTYLWKDHNTDGYIYGHKLMLLGLVDTKRKVLIPVFWEILHREDKRKESIHKKGWEVALDLLNQAVQFGFPQYTVLMDSWFAGKELFEKLNNAGFSFVIELKSNRKVVKYKRTTFYESVKIFFSNRFRHKIWYLNRPKWASSAILTLNEMKDKVKVVAVANKKGLAHECFAYYATNQLAWDATKVWGLARDRWSIEVQFRDLKQLFALGGAAVRSNQSVETSISITMIALTVVRLEQLKRVDANENQYKRPCSASSIVQQTLIESLHRGISKLAASDNIKIMNKLRRRLKSANFGKKPTEKLENVKNTA